MALLIGLRGGLFNRTLTPEKTAEEIAVDVGVTKRTIERTLVSLKKKGLIERIGSNKSGSWVVVQ